MIAKIEQYESALQEKQEQLVRLKEERASSLRMAEAGKAKLEEVRVDVFLCRYTVVEISPAAHHCCHWGLVYVVCVTTTLSRMSRMCLSFLFEHC